MTFVNPWLLAGASLVAIPIVLHLIMRRKPQHFEFPALRLVQDRHDVNRRRLRLRHLLLLALRMLAILLFAVALARPSVKLSGSLGTQEAPVAAALVFETSKRMEYQHRNRSRLEVAQELGLWLLAQLPDESQIAVLDTRPGPAAFQVDRGAAKHRIEHLSAVANSQSLLTTLDEAVRLVEQSELERREIYVFTDMARVSWPSQSATQLMDRLARMPDVGIYLIDVGVDDPTNTALGELRLSGEVLSSRSPVRIETEVSHRGLAAERTAELFLLEPDPEKPADGGLTPQKQREKTVELEPGRAQQIDFEIGSLKIGTHQGYVRLTGQDGLACDDRRFFTVEVKSAWRILVAAPEPPREYALFLTQMLAPASYVRSGQARFDCRVIALDQLAEHALEPYSAVCLVDPTPLEPAVWQKLGDFVSEGHGLAVFLGHKANSIESFNHPAAQELLAGKLVRQARRPDGDVHLAPQRFQHPMLAEFRDLAGSIPWQGMPVFRYWQLDDPGPGVDVVVRFNDGQPAILERPLGKGRVLTMTTPVSDDPNRRPWNLLPAGESWPFFILANEMAAYLVGSSDRQLNYFAGQTATLRLDPDESFPSYVLTALDAPDEVDARLTPDLREHVLTITSTDKVGNYRVRAGGSTSGVALGFSVNLAPEQTRLDRLSEEELSELFGDVPYRIARDRNQLEGDRRRQRVGRELFGLLILLMAVALGIEHVLANRFYRD